MLTVVNSGSTTTDPTKDYTVKIDATGLLPNTWYYYEFTALGKNSIRGRTRTTPIANGDSLRFAVVSCANYEAGFFNVYKVIKERNDIDAVISLGDYIYEYETGGYSPNPTSGRAWEPQDEITTLSDYRTRYSTYHLDEDLMRLHQQYPFIVVWDDHESANDAWKDGAENHTPGTEGNWINRKSEAKQAFFEWLPIRVTGTTDPYQIYRDISFGNLLELVMLDTRLHGRDEQAGTSGSTVTDNNRQLLGTDQFNWLGNRLSNSNAQWKILAQQVMMAPLEVFGFAVNGDQWDGYPAERDRVFNYILQNNISNVVVLTGDIHSSWANDLPTSSYNSGTGAGSAGVEFVTPSVTSPGVDLGVGASLIQLSNDHIKYVDLSLHGFILLDVNQTRVQSDWYYVNTIDNSSGGYSYGESYYVNQNQRHLNSTNNSSQPRPGLTGTIQAPECPRAMIFTNVSNVSEDLTIIGVYPNPAINELSLQLFTGQSDQVKTTILDLNGKQIDYHEYSVAANNTVVLKMDLSTLSTGIYLLKVESNGQQKVLKFMVN